VVGVKQSNGSNWGGAKAGDSLKEENKKKSRNQDTRASYISGKIRKQSGRKTRRGGKLEMVS